MTKQLSLSVSLRNFQVHIDAFSGKHYCPRMATMNKPAYQAIRTHSPDKPVCVFVYQLYSYMYGYIDRSIHGCIYVYIYIYIYIYI